MTEYFEWKTTQTQEVSQEIRKELNSSRDARKAILQHILDLTRGRAAPVYEGDRVESAFVAKMECGTGPLHGEETIRKMAAFFGKNPMNS